MELRKYQLESKEAVLKEWEDGNKRTLLVLPTGCGKTIVFSSIAGELAKNGETVLTLAHREELLTQAMDKQYSVTGIMPALEKADSSCIAAYSPLVVGSVQTLCRQKRLERFPKNYFSTIIIDEAHHALSDSYQGILEYFDQAKVLGVTATPDRADKKQLSKIFDSLAYEYSMRDAIKEGYLSPIKCQTIPLKIDISNVHTKMGDYDSNELVSALEPYLEEIADHMKEYCRGKHTVVFLPLVAISQRFAEILNSKGFHAIEVNGSSENRSEILEDFSVGKYDVICNAMLLTEGWDCPCVDCIIVLRPTQSRALYQQMVGRGTRLCEGKDHLLLLDFLWMTSKHNLCRPCSLVAKTQEVADRITELIELDENEYDLLEAEEKAERDVVAEREKSLADALKANQLKKKRLINPLDIYELLEDFDLATYEPAFEWERAPATEKQLKTLEKFGVNIDFVETKGLASKLLDVCVERSSQQLATLPQVKLLKRYGFVNVAQWKMKTATQIISRIAAHNWRLPGGFDPKTYIPNEVKSA